MASWLLLLNAPIHTYIYIYDNNNNNNDNDNDNGDDGDDGDDVKSKYSDCYHRLTRQGAHSKIIFIKNINIVIIFNKKF